MTDRESSQGIYLDVEPGLESPDGQLGTGLVNEESPMVSRESHILTDEVSRQFRQQQFLTEFTKRCLAGGELAELFDHALQHAAALLDTAYGKVAEGVRGSQTGFRIHAVKGFSPAMMEGAYDPEQEPIVAATLTSGQPVVVKNIYQDPRFQPSRLHKEYGIVSCVAVVIYGTRNPYGVMKVAHTEERVFSDSDVVFLQSVANILGIVIERRQAEEEAREADARYRLVVDATNDGIYDWDVVRGHVFWSDRYYAMLGLEPGEIIPTYENFLELVHPDDRERVAAEIRQHLASRENYVMEYRIRHKQGHYLYIICRGGTFFNESGAPVRLTGLIRDITLEKNAELAIRESESRFRAMADSSPVLIWMSDETGGGTYFNQTWLKFTGRSMEQEAGFGWTEGIHPEDREECLRVCTEAKEARADITMEFRLRRADGEYRWMLDTASPRYTADGRFVGYIGSMVDITDRKRAEENLQAQYNLNQTLMDNATSALFLWDASGRCTYLNATAERLIGYSAEEVQGKLLHELVHHTRPDGSAYATEDCPIHNAVINQTPYSVEEDFIIAKDGTLVPVSYTVSPIEKQGDMEGAVVEVRDIRARKAAEQALEHANARIRRLVESNIIGVVFWRCNGEIYEANDAFLQMVGYTREEMLEGRIDWIRMTPPEYAWLDERAFLQMNESGVCDPYEKQYIHKDGHRIDIQLGIALSDRVAQEGVAYILDITDRKRAEQSLKRSYDREKLNRRILEIISMPTDLAGILSAVAEEVGRFMGVDRCILMNYVPDEAAGFRVELNGQYCADPEYAKVSIEDFPREKIELWTRNLKPEHAIRLINTPTRESYVRDITERVGEILSDPAEQADAIALMSELMFERYRVQSNLRIGVAYQGRPMGALSLHQCTRVRHWTDEEISMLQDIANYLGIALYQAELFRHEQEARHALQKSNELLGIISSAQAYFITQEDIYQLFEHPFNRVLEYMDSEYGFIGEILHTEEGRPYLKCNFLSNIAWNEETRRLYNESRETGFEFHKLDNLFGQVITTGQVVISNDPDHDPRSAGRPPGHPPLRSFLGLPMYKEGELVGMIGLANRPNGYTEDHVRDLQPFVDACSNIIQGYRNERLREKLTHELKVSERALKIYAGKLERSNQELERFATIASHDLQAPLRKVIMFSDFLRNSSTTLPPETLDYIERIQKATRRMQNLITDLLSLSRVHRKGQPFRSVSMETVTREALVDLEEVLRASGGTVHVREGLPSLEGDATQLQQLMQNLLGNALKFCRPGVPPVVEVSASMIDSETCEIRVADNGIGFDEKYLDRIFSVFERLHGENEYEGTGIGLAICQKIVERHGGFITATSRPGEGATFIVQLPLARNPAQVHSP